MRVKGFGTTKSLSMQWILFIFFTQIFSLRFYCIKKIDIQNGDFLWINSKNFLKIIKSKCFRENDFGR